MKDKFHKLISLFKKYGILGTLKKIIQYVKSTILTKFNIFTFCKTNFKKKKYIRQISGLINSSDVERIIVWRSSFGWDVPLYQRPQHIAKNLSINKTLVLYEVTTLTDNVNTLKKQDENLYLVNFNNVLINKWIMEEIQKSSKPKYIQLYSTNWSMSVDELQSYIDSGFKILYEYIDDLNPALAGTKDLPVNIKEKYEYILKDTANVFVVVTADEIEKDILSKRGKEKLCFACNGVDIKHFQNLNKNFNFDLDFENIIKERKPIIGYYGALASWFDYDMIKYLAKERPNYNIVLFGIKYDDEFDKHNLNNFKNIYFLGSRNYMDLPNYASKFTVCTIPFLINDITKATSPVKLFEYMALGKPIVTTAMHECKKYQSVMIANNKKDFIQLIDSATSFTKEKNKCYFDLLEKEANDNSWEMKANSIINLLKKYE